MLAIDLLRSSSLFPGGFIFFQSYCIRSRRLNIDEIHETDMFCQLCSVNGSSHFSNAKPSRINRGLRVDRDGGRCGNES